MKITPYGKEIDIASLMESLRISFDNYQIPIVTLIAVQEKDPFKVLISTMLSSRTKDQTTAAASKRLYERANTPQELAELPESEIEKLIYPVGFWRTKAPRIKAAAQKLIDSFNGQVPESIEELMSFEGVGRKTANLVLGEAFRKEAICVDVHVHRISNRLGIIETKTPYETEQMLEEVLPKKHWIRYNTYIVAHGQQICKPISPICSQCPITAFCKRIGVEKSR
ncbi:endonuclease III domain-containing protein [Sedimentisphaera salicampi]|uniref:endonuclease III domain-containing protein n=1 Tax=Sedimentisphaera salicampi TaxID=1941349 RepID=UPI000B9BA74B|nr:endonuclease III [Sedimentisphaera salicampi]OXU15655.1 UV-endonuclease [Sedimentisphaera salicampi]